MKFSLIMCLCVWVCIYLLVGSINFPFYAVELKCPTSYPLFLCSVLGSTLTMNGCHKHYSIFRGINGFYTGIDAKQGLYAPLVYGETANRIKLEMNSDSLGKSYVLKTADFWSSIFQIIFQVHPLLRIGLLQKFQISHKKISFAP